MVLVLAGVSITGLGCRVSGRGRAGITDQDIAKLREQLEACRKAHLANASHDEVQRLRVELGQQNNAAQLFQQRDVSLRRILDESSRGVCLLHGKFGFVDPAVGTEELVTDETGGPLELAYIGSGFRVSAEGDVVTNRHVAEPWWNNSSVAQLLGRGWVPRLLCLTAYFPGQAPRSVDLSTIRVSQKADVAAMTVNAGSATVLPLSAVSSNEYRGQRIVLMGYPTGLSALLARAEPEIVEDILGVAVGPESVLEELAKRGAISPIITQGALNEITAGKLVYDAETTSGGSGGPVIAMNGSVIGVNFAITRDFHGSNFGVPVRFVRELLGEPH